MPAVPPLCLTGASGFVGRRVLARLAALGASDVTLLTRDAVRDAGLRLRPEWRTASFDLARPGDPYEIPQGSVVLHLASATGSAPPATSRRLNVDGTRALIGAARRAAVRHFVYVSSVAAGYGDKRWSHYAQSKAAAEGLVAACGLPFTLVRPTIVFGPGSPNQRALERLATLALPLLPGKGDVLVQPIHVDDLAGALVDVATAAVPARDAVTVAGPSVLTLRELLAAIREARGLAQRRPLALPLAPLRRVLAALDVLTLRRLPVSAGQFAVFANDSCAPAVAPRHDLAIAAPCITLASMLAERSADA